MSNPIVNVFDIDEVVIHDQDVVEDVKCPICYELVQDTDSECRECN